MGTLIVVDCEAPFGVGAPSVGDMTEFGAVDVNALREGRVETFHGVDCSEDTFRQFREWLDAADADRLRVGQSRVRLPVDQLLLLALLRREPVRAFRDGASPTSTRGWSVISEARRSGSGFDERSTIIIRCTTRSGTPRRSFESSTVNDEIEGLGLKNAGTALAQRDGSTIQPGVDSLQGSSALGSRRSRFATARCPRWRRQPLS